MIDLSVLIPAREEEWLDLTIIHLLESIEGNTEVIVVLDGYLPNPPLTVNDPRVTLIYNPISKGQRGAANQAAKLAKGKYVMKMDAHVALDKGFDVKMLEAFKITGDNVTMIPVMRNLHVFDWVCPAGHRKYQGKDSICIECSKQMVKEVMWYPKPSPARFTFTFDKTMHFQYWGDLAKRPENVAMGNLRETMSIQGSCFMLTKEKYFELDICSEDFHSWGQQGVEVACKTWLSGGRVIANLNTWYAHMFRTNNFGGFPYSNPQSKVDANREKSRELFQRDKWPQAIHTFKWLLDKFNPPDWTSSKGMIYYTDNQLDESIAKPVRDRLLEISQKERILIVSSSLKKIDFGVKNIHFPSLKRGYAAISKQILGALENSTADVIFFTEHDVLYHSTHFDFIPPSHDTFYYNQNVWYVRKEDGFAIHYDVNQLSGLCVYRDTAIIHFRERQEMIEKEGYTYNMGFEPFSHGRVSWKNQFKLGIWKSQFPNIDIRYGGNATRMRWKKDQYRNQQLLINWQESTIDKIEGWTAQDFEFLKVI
jgi:glycosyltransferase involved in cell wall biosynthesis